MHTKILSLLLCTGTLCCSCKQEYDLVDTTDINALALERSDIGNPEQLIMLFYTSHESTAGGPLNIHAENYGHGEYRIELIHEAPRGKNYAAIRYVLHAQQRSHTWFVSEIQRSCKCPRARRPQHWQPCRCG